MYPFHDAVSDDRTRGSLVEYVRYFASPLWSAVILALTWFATRVIVALTPKQGLPSVEMMTPDPPSRTGPPANGHLPANVEEAEIETRILDCEKALAAREGTEAEHRWLRRNLSGLKRRIAAGVRDGDVSEDGRSRLAQALGDLEIRYELRKPR